MKPTEGISVDGGCSGNPGEAYYRAVDISTGEELFRHNIGVATNNIAEFLGLCHAIHIADGQTIYSDSQTALAWVRKKKVNSSYSEVKIDKRLRSAENFLRNSKNSSKLIKWNTKSWGEIPADFGYKNR